MEDYFVNMNAQSNGDHEVHKNGCSYLALVRDKKHLGRFFSCQEAVRKAKETYSTADGCFYCARECHTS